MAQSHRRSRYLALFSFLLMALVAPLVGSVRPASAATEVRFAMYNISPAWNGTLQKAIDSFQAANPDIKVKLEFSPSDQYFDKLQTEYAAGSAPDITIMNADRLVPLASRGTLVDLKPLMARDGVTQDAYWYPLDKEWGYNGGIYGGLLYAGGQALYVNKDLLTAANVPFPADNWTWNDLLADAKTLTDPSKNNWGVYISPIAPPYWSSAFVQAAGGSVLNDARDKCTLTDPASQQGLQFISDLIHTDKVMPVPPPSSQAANQPNPFLTGHVAFYFGGTWDEAAARTAGFNWDYAHFPLNPTTGKRSVQEGSNAWSILSSSKHQEESWKVVKYLMGEDGQRQLMTLGIPGLKDLVQSQDYLSIHAPQNISIPVADFTEAGHDYYATTDSAEWWNAADQELQPLWTGDEDVATATTKACQRIDAVFAKRSK
jgi:multiple sugar transport system substrate-binding protein